MAYAPLTSRRTVLKGLAGLAATAPFLAACGGSDSGAAANAVTFGSNGSEATLKATYQALTDAFTKATGVEIKTNTVDNNTFQKTISSYLQGTPDDVFSWYAGYRMQVFAGKGLLQPIDAIWPEIQGNFAESTRRLSLGADGKPYFVPLYNYPTGVFFRKSLFAEKGYQVPGTYDDLVTLAGRMKNDGISPFAHGIAQGDGWTLLNTFDYLNLRLNGYDFHRELMRGRGSWADPKVRAVLDQWARIVPFLQPGGAGRKWQDATQSLVAKQAGMAVTGMFVAGQFKGADAEDLDFFQFPVLDPANGQDVIEAPTDGFLLRKEPKNLDGALKFAKFLGTAEAANVLLSADKSNLSVVTGADTAQYTALQRKASEAIKNAKQVSQFGDRDSDPGFMSDVVTTGLASFLEDPAKADSVLQSIESQKSRFFTA